MIYINFDAIFSFIIAFIMFVMINYLSILAWAYNKKLFKKLAFLLYLFCMLYKWFKRLSIICIIIVNNIFICTNIFVIVILIVYLTIFPIKYDILITMSWTHTILFPFPSRVH